MRSLGGARVAGIAAGFALGVAAVASASPPAITTVVSSELAAWPAGPVRWLLLPDELETFRHLRSDESARAFVREFWRRRDPSPGTAANPFAEEVSKRIELADQLYAGEGKRGSLTDRGGALLLLGPPVYLSVGSRREPSADMRRHPAAMAPGALPTRKVEFEEWGYPPANLPPRLLEREPGLARSDRVRLVFVRKGGETVLREGRAVLAAAARAARVAPEP